MREAERRAEAAEARLTGKPEPTATETAEEGPVAPDPNDDKYEFGEADPAYLADLTDYKVDLKLAERDKAAQDRADQAAQSESLTALDTQWNEKAAAAVEKYPDFEEKVVESAAAGDWACPPLVAAAISSSDVGADVAYHLASNPAEAEVIAAQLSVNPMVAAEAFGFIEGGFLDKAPARPGANAHPLDVALYAGRLRAFHEKGAAPKGKIATDAPEPAQHRVRGGSGQFEVGGDTSDFAAFEKKAMGGKR